MSKSDLAVALKEKAGLASNAEGMRALNATMEILTDTLAREGSLSLIGFGSFKVVEAKARTAHNPVTRAIVNVPAKKRVRFSASGVLKQLVNGKVAAPRDEGK